MCVWVFFPYLKGWSQAHNFNVPKLGHGSLSVAFLQAGNLCQTNATMENRHFLCINQPEITMFHSYAELPEGTNQRQRSIKILRMGSGNHPTQCMWMPLG